MANIRKIFCADDWGMSPSINDAIIALIEKKLIYSVSILVEAEFIDYRLNDLLEYHKSNEIMLSFHFNLTYGTNYRSPLDLISSYIFKKLDKGLIEVLLMKQLAIAKEKKINFDIIDGHHHVHLLPFVFSVMDKNFGIIKIKKIRLMIDKSHLSSFLLSLLNIQLYKKQMMKWEKEECGYLLESDLQTEDIFNKKIVKFNRLIIHPARYNDFDQINFYDKLTTQRVNEFIKILEYSR